MLRIAPVAALLLSLTVTPSLAQETRQPVPRTEAERAFILDQMRLFLGSVQAIASALADNDLTTVAAAATARGRRGTPVSAIPPGMKAKETPAWTAMMGGARGGFDTIAAAAESGAAAPRIMAMMGDTMRNCVACHQAYHLTAE